MCSTQCLLEQATKFTRPQPQSGCSAAIFTVSPIRIHRARGDGRYSLLESRRDRCRLTKTRAGFLVGEAMMGERVEKGECCPRCRDEDDIERDLTRLLAVCDGESPLPSSPRGNKIISPEIETQKNNWAFPTEQNLA